MISIKSDDGVIIRYMWVDTIECAMCGNEIDYSPIGLNYGVPWYCGPTRSDFPNAGGKTVCKSCYDKWFDWNELRT